MSEHSYHQYTKDQLAFIEHLFSPAEEDVRKKNLPRIVRLVEEYQMYKTNFARNVKFQPSSLDLCKKHIMVHCKIHCTVGGHQGSILPTFWNASRNEISYRGYFGLTMTDISMILQNRINLA